MTFKKNLKNIFLVVFATLILSACSTSKKSGNIEGDVYTGKATVKYLDTISGKKYLIPANKNYQNYEINENTQPVGKVVSLFRDI